MQIILSREDMSRMEELKKTQERNGRALEMTSAYLLRRPRWVTAADVETVAACGVTDEQAYTALMAAGMGLDEQDNPEDKAIGLDYVAPSIRQLDAETYRSDPYFQNIRVPEKWVGDWELGRKEYAPYEAFVRADMRIYGDFREVAQVGFFPERFSYPCVSEKGREWMTVTPNEVETMKGALAQARGDAAAFGLGLGYFAYMASEKTEVRSVTVVERDEAVIELFREHILPQFAHADKIRIVQADAFDFAARGMRFDTAFVDLWHDVSDGAEMYIKMKKMERLSPDTRFDYWIETGILSFLRFHVFWYLDAELSGQGDGRLDDLLGISRISDFETIEELLSDRALRKLAERLDSIGLLTGE